MQNLIERKDLVEQLLSPDTAITTDDCLYALKAWAEKKKSQGYAVSRLTVLLADVGQEIRDMRWVGGQNDTR